MSSAGALPAPFYLVAQVITALLIVCGLAIGFRNITQGSFSYSDSALTALLCAQLIMLAGTAAVRSGPLPWGPGGEQHYGALGITLIATSWILVSKAFSSQGRSYLAVLLLLIFTASYVTTAKWRLDNNPQRIRDSYAISEAFKSDLTPREMLLLRPTQLMGIDQFFPEVPQAIAELRSNGMHFYKGTYSIDAPRQQFDSCHIDEIDGKSVQEIVDIPRKAQIEIRGWGFDPNLLRQPSTIGLMVTDPSGQVRMLKALGNQPRADIEKAKGVSNAGIYAVLDTMHFKNGKYFLGVIIQSGTTSYLCKQQVTVDIQ
jgi:hypothetical protein